MKHLKLFENKKEGLHLIMLMEEGLPEFYWLFKNKKDKNLFLIQLIHEKESKGQYNSNYECKDIFDPDELLNYWNEKYSGDLFTDTKSEIYDEFVTFVDNVKINPILEMRMNAKKYNI